MTEEGISGAEMEVNLDEDQPEAFARQEEALTSARIESPIVHCPVNTWNGDRLRQLGAGTCLFGSIILDLTSNSPSN